MNKRELTQFAKRAQVAVGLSHWEIEYFFTDIPPEDCGLVSAYSTELGLCATNENHRMASIWVNPNDQDGEKNSVLDTIVHELLHVWTAEIGIDCECQDWRVEAGINKLSPLIVAALGT